MSVDPLAASAAGGADLAALVDAEIAALAADAQALRALLVEGAVVTARVLPSNGLTDLLEIAGRRVAASFPPSVSPGDVLQVRVTGFDGERILLQIVGSGANAAVEPGPPNLPAVPDPGVFVAASIRQTAATPEAPPAPAASVPTPAGASVDPESLPPTAPPSPPGAGAGFGSVVSRANVTPAPVPPQQQRGMLIPAPVEPTTVEARLAAARAAIAQRAPSPNADPAARPAVVAPPPAAASRFVVPPPIVPKGAPPAASDSASRASPTSPPAANAAVRSTGLSAYTEPVALLRALKLPVTPSGVAAASLALEQPHRLPAALAALERALPRASADPHVATLRTLLAFVGRIDPRSPVLAAQIAAYVDHVVDGAEPKLAMLLAASSAANSSVPMAPMRPSSPQATAAATQASPDARADSPATSRSIPPSATTTHDARPIPAAVAAERTSALAADLKQTLLAVAGDPATPASLAPALGGALTALTAVQLTAAQTLAAHPDGIAFTIPLTTPNGSATAQITVKRDAPEGRGARVDADNFRIAFVLDTAHYGTVAIDLVTVGRDVTVDVRTEAAPAMRAFRDALGTLTARLEGLRYRVASAGASVGTTTTIAVDVPPQQAPDPDATVDRSA